MGADPRILLQEKQTDLLTPDGVCDSGKVSGVSREQIRLLNQRMGWRACPQDFLDRITGFEGFTGLC